MAVAYPSALCYHDVEQYAHADLPQTVACEFAGSLSQWSLLHPQHPRPPLLAGTDGRGGLSERKRPVCLHRHRSGHGLYLPRTAGLVLGILAGTHAPLWSLPTS